MADTYLFQIILPLVNSLAKLALFFFACREAWLSLLGNDADRGRRRENAKLAVMFLILFEIAGLR